MLIPGVGWSYLVMRMDAFRKDRCMPFVKRGMRVEHTYDGRKGRVSGANSSANLNITFDGKSYSENCHPKWMMKYFDADGNVIADYGA
jgi:hypothetical protein